MRQCCILYDTLIWQFFQKRAHAKYINKGLFWLYSELFLPFHHGDGQSRWSYRCQMRQCYICIWHSNLTSFFQSTQAKYINNGLFWLYLELFLPFHHGDGQSRWCCRCQMRRCCRARRSPCCRLTSRCPRILCNLCIVVIKVIAYKSRSELFLWNRILYLGLFWAGLAVYRVTVSLDY